MVSTGTVGQRFTRLIAHLGISKNAFASSLDKTATVIQHIVDERNKPGFDLLCKVFEVYPNVSKDWLLQGTGPMLTTEALVEAEIPKARATASLRAEGLRPAVTTVAAPAAEAEAGPVAEIPPVQAPEPATVHSPSAAVIQSVLPEPVAAPVVAAAPAPQAEATAPAPAAAQPQPDSSWQTALYTQQMAHQLAMAELRNQHLQEQQRMMQQMMDLMKQQMFK
ncbi:hypothetical protein LGH70_06180 [Hymenobacter sp. BT635]|uniref:XRE family transcriptional regulator n=1 Tax=Hymenobacter nitidus TaxID=2880929 RepID=A0ABS8AA54_9BACT|nr:hypothetical protein [Hymenobacter nitidus]MCB2377161.1 hypothetical protein [Hymenobacter nitidus]